MKIKENKSQQIQRLKDICILNDTDYNSLSSLLESVKSKKIKRVNYHQQKIVDIIEKATK